MCSFLTPQFNPNEVKSLPLSKGYVELDIPRTVCGFFCSWGFRSWILEGGKATVKLLSQETKYCFLLHFSWNFKAPAAVFIFLPLELISSLTKAMNHSCCFFRKPIVISWISGFINFIVASPATSTNLKELQLNWDIGPACSPWSSVENCHLKE